MELFIHITTDETEHSDPEAFIDDHEEVLDHIEHQLADMLWEGCFLSADEIQTLPGDEVEL